MFVAVSDLAPPRPDITALRFGEPARGDDVRAFLSALGVPIPEPLAQAGVLDPTRSLNDILTELADCGDRPAAVVAISQFKKCLSLLGPDVSLMDLHEGDPALRLFLALADEVRRGELTRNTAAQCFKVFTLAARRAGVPTGHWPKLRVVPQSAEAIDRQKAKARARAAEFRKRRAQERKEG